MHDRGQEISGVLARSLYDGNSDEPLQNQFIEIKQSRIGDVRAPAPADIRRGKLIEADIVAPGFVDMQINGAADAQFNSDPTPETIAAIATGARQGGTAHLLPTFITAPDRAYDKAIEAANRALDTGIPGILGIHLEGPFLSPDRPGIHPAKSIRRLSHEDVEAIKRAKGVVLVTLAPECQHLALIRLLKEAGVTIFIGHSNATTSDIEKAIEAGVRGVTHLFNAQAPMMAREPGVVGNALMREDLFAGIIADGHHVHPQNLATAARLMPDRLCLVTDAMQTLAGSVKAFDLQGTKITLAEGRLTGPDGTLAGAHLAMDKAVRNAIQMMNVSPVQALRMASRNPARALGLSDTLGTIKPAGRASLTLLDTAFRAIGVVVDGRFFQTAGSQIT